MKYELYLGFLKKTEVFQFPTEEEARGKLAGSQSPDLSWACIFRKDGRTLTLIHDEDWSWKR